ncbi:unnamed protein product, partial [Rhizoctonia solani]
MKAKRRARALGKLPTRQKLLSLNASTRTFDSDLAPPKTSSRKQTSQVGNIGFNGVESWSSSSTGTQALFYAINLPPFFDAHSGSHPEGIRSVSDPVKRTQPSGRRKGLALDQLPRSSSATTETLGQPRAGLLAGLKGAPGAEDGEDE